MSNGLTKSIQKKPAIVITRFPYESSWGGEESHTLTLANYFRRKGYEVIFFGSCPVLLKKFTELGFPTKYVWGGKMVVTPLELIKSFFLFPLIRWNMRRHFLQLLRDYEIKAMYCLSVNEKLLLTPEALKRSIPVTWVEHQEIRDWLIKNPWKVLYQKFAPHVKIVPISQKNREKLLEELSIPNKNLFDIVHGIDLHAERQVARKIQKGLIVTANRFIPKKGIMDFLRAITPLLNKRPELEVKVVGEGEEESIIKKYIEERLQGKNVECLPFLKKENWIELLSKTDVFVSSARDSNETFSLTTAEALASGCKVVVTRCAGIADFLKDGDNAFIAEPLNPDSLGSKIEQALLEDEKMRGQAKITAQEHFDQNRMLEEYESLILRAPS